MIFVLDLWFNYIGKVEMYDCAECVCTIKNLLLAYNFTYNLNTNNLPGGKHIFIYIKYSIVLPEKFQHLYLRQLLIILFTLLH